MAKYDGEVRWRSTKLGEVAPRQGSPSTPLTSYKAAHESAPVVYLFLGRVRPTSTTSLYPRHPNEHRHGHA